VAVHAPLENVALTALAGSDLAPERYPIAVPADLREREHRRVERGLGAAVDRLEAALPMRPVTPPATLSRRSTAFKPPYPGFRMRVT